MRQLECGQAISAILNELTKINPDIKPILNGLSYFNIETNFEETQNTQDSIVSVLYNYISRGLPTYTSTFIEDILSNTFIKTRKNKSENNSFEYNFVNDEYNDDIIKALHIIDPRQELKDIVPSEFLQNNLFKSLVEEYIDVHIGRHFIHKLSYNRPIKNIFETSSKRRQLFEIKALSTDEIAPVSCEIPYYTVSNGIILQTIEPSEKHTLDYFELENLNENLHKINWQDKLIISSVRQNSEEITKIEEFSYEKYFDFLRRNYTSPLYKSDSGLIAMQLALTPFAIARIEKTILYCILQGRLNLNDEKWRIGVIERDVPASYLAIEDLKQHFEQIFVLEGKNRKLPEIELTIYNTPEFEQAELNLLYQGTILPLQDFDSSQYFDLLIDLSILQVHNYSPFIDNSAKTFVRVRSSNFHTNQRNFAIAPKISYKIPNFNPTITKDEKQKDIEQKVIDSLIFFLKNTFHKAKLSYLQTKFFHNIFSNKNTLASVPAQEQFELIYIISALLQPNISIVITYLMANIKYRIDFLFSYHIDCLSYYSPSTQNIYDKIQAINKLQTAQSIFNFITPDRLHILQFREILQQIAQKSNYISYIIVKHSHCVSERSFDFNPLYPSINKNFKLFFNKPPQYICLSDTASYDIINDISYYFEINPSYVIQIELKLSNVRLNIEHIENDTITDEQSVEKIKIEKIAQLCQNDKTIFINNNPLYFEQKLKDQNVKVTVFEGTIDYKSHFISTTKSRISYRNYRKFNNSDEYNVLSSNSTLPLSCTLNVSKIIFYNLPFSIELFIQTLNKAYHREKVDVHILISKLKKQTTVQETVLLPNYNFEQVALTKDLEIDNIYRLEEFQKFYPNILKETKIIKELWNNISYPAETLSDILCRRVFFSFDKQIRLEIPYNINPTKLYIIDQNNQNLGYIDFQDNLLVCTAPQSEQDIANQILEFIQYDIEKIVNNPLDIFQILNEPFNLTNNSQSIYGIYSNYENDIKQNITVEFYNSAAFDFIDKTKDILSPTPTFNQIIYIYEQSIDLEYFRKNILSNFVLQNQDKKEYLDEQINLLYNNFRTFYDTLMAIYRLYSINIVDDFTIDFQNQHFILQVSKKNDTDILNTIYKKISIYTTRNKAFEIFENVHKFPGSSIIEKAINYYQKFIFETVCKEYQQQMHIIEHYIENVKDNPQKIIPLLNNYFTAKYLFDLEKQMHSNNLEFIEKYFSKKHIFYDDLKHLYRSSELLLNTTPDNHNLIIINGLTGILLSKNDNELTTNIAKLAKGFSIFRETKECQKIEIEIQNILSIIEQFDYELKNKIYDLLLLKIHTFWLNSFNRKLKHFFNNKLK